MNETSVGGARVACFHFLNLSGRVVTFGDITFFCFYFFKLEMLILKIANPIWRIEFIGIDAIGLICLFIIVIYYNKSRWNLRESIFRRLLR